MCARVSVCEHGVSAHPPPPAPPQPLSAVLRAAVRGAPKKDGGDLPRSSLLKPIPRGFSIRGDRRRAGSEGSAGGSAAQTPLRRWPPRAGWDFVFAFSTPACSGRCKVSSLAPCSFANGSVPSGFWYALAEMNLSSMKRSCIILTFS